jgi:inner membrane protein
MDNLTHSLVGLTAAKAGLERLSPGATTLCIIAANAPDADVAVIAFADRWTFLQHHRGITHAIVGVLAISILLPALFYLGDLILSKVKRRPQQVRFGGLLLASLLVSATHPLLDWTNNYGIRFFLPWNSRWSYGDLVFIVDPFIWLLLGSTCFLLTSKSRLRRLGWLLLGAVLTVMIVFSSRGANLPAAWLLRGIWLGVLIGLFVLFKYRVGEILGGQLARVALITLVAYWFFLSYAHSNALTRAREEAEVVKSPGETVSRIVAMPTLANPFRWDCVFETDKASYRFNLKLLGSAPVAKPIRYEKPSGRTGQAFEAIESDRRAQIFLGFARFPVAKLADPDCATQTLVQLADLRYTEPGTQRGTFSLDIPIDCTTLINGR